MTDEETVEQTSEERARASEARPTGEAGPADTGPELDDVEVEREEGVPPVAELDPETRARRDGALRQVRKFGDPVLRASAVPVDRFDKVLGQEIERMTELMHDALGVGLAATQVGIVHRVLVYKAYLDDPVTAMVNPVLEWSSEETELGEEGCLSIPGVHVEVERALRVRVRAQDETGDEFETEAEGLPARIIQHEMDHLDGVLILDRISREARKEAMRAMREAVEGEHRPQASDSSGNGAEPSGAAEQGEDAEPVADAVAAESGGA
jgi:peptide deformylase